MNNISNRIDWIDSLKGFTIICVVFGHVIRGYIVSKSLTPDLSIPFHYIYNTIYSFHMPLFIIISGMMFSKAYYISDHVSISIKRESYKLQLFNLIIVYFIHSIVFCISKILFPQYVANDVDIHSLLFIPIKPVQMYWYLFVLIELYLIFGLLRNVNRKLLFASLFTLSIISWLVTYPLPYFELRRVLFYSFFFYMGILLNDFFLFSKKIIYSTTLSLLTVSIILIVIFWNSETNLSNIPIANTFIAIGISLFLIVLFQNSHIVNHNHLLIYFGKISLEIYLIHSYISTICRTLLKFLGVTNIILSAFIGFIISIVGSCLITFLLKKINIHKYIFKPYTILVKK